jgi:hypothetical protein
VQRGTRVGHDYILLGALRGPHKRMEAHLVALTERSEVFPLFQHPGTELLFMLEGEMLYGHGEAVTGCARVTPCSSTARPPPRHRGA